MTTYTRHAVSDGDLWGLIQNHTHLEPSDSVSVSATCEPDGWEVWKKGVNKQRVEVRSG